MRKFVRTRAQTQPPAPAPAPASGSGATHRYSNGHAAGYAANGATTTGAGAGAGAGDLHSTLSSRYWSGSSRSGSGAGSWEAGGGADGALWEDAEFPCTWRALGDKRQAAGVLWLRPHELCGRPRFRGDTALEAAEPAPEPAERGAARWRVAAGPAGAALPAAAAALSLTPRLLSRVAPHQSFRHGYTGAFTFSLWVFGAWREVVVDDRLPTRGGRLLAAHCALPDDFTLPLLEKAFAKLHGSYAAARRADTALAELTGGVVQRLSPGGARARLLHVLRAAAPRATLLLASLHAQDTRQDKERAARARAAGLVAEQAYCVMGLARARGAADDLVRLRAPAGGAYTGGHPLATEPAEPGTFWMSLEEFVAAFGRLELVHVPPDDWLLEPALRARRPWRAVLARRRWRRGYNAGGPPTAPTTGANPQFHVSVPESAGGGGGGGRCHAVVSVTQQYSPREAGALLAVGFAVYELPAGAPPGRVALPGPRMLEVTHSSRAREVATLCTLPPGEYLVVPHACRPHSGAGFLLRLYTDTHTDVWEVNEDNTILRTISEEFLSEEQAPLVVPPALSGAEEGAGVLDAEGLRAALRAGGRRVSSALALALVVGRDGALAGRVPARDLPALHALHLYWTHAFSAGGGGRRGCGAGAGSRRLSTYSLRAALRAAGVSVSNKVLECMVVRFARGHHITEEGFMLALARIHLAHERYRKLESKMKSNPLSLEEMILMTVYT